MLTFTKKIPCSGIDENDFVLQNTNLSSAITNYNNLKDEASSSDYARLYVNKTVSTMSYVFLQFDFSSIPADAIIKNIDGKVRLYSSGSGTYCYSRQIRWCLGNGTTWMKYSENFSTSSNPIAIEVEDLRSSITREQLDDVKCRVQYTRTSRKSNTQYYIYIYGADVTVTYEIPGIYIKQNGLWQPTNSLYIKNNNIWEEKADTDFNSNQNIKQNN